MPAEQNGHPGVRSQDGLDIVSRTAVVLARVFLSDSSVGHPFDGRPYCPNASTVCKYGHPRNDLLIHSSFHEEINDFWISY